MAVGVAVASGLADAGLGVRAAAQALKLDFIPLANEQYDLLCLRPFYESARGAQLMAIIRSQSLRSAVVSLGGYDPVRAGAVLYSLSRHRLSKPPIDGAIVVRGFSPSAGMLFSAPTSNCLYSLFPVGPLLH